MKTSLSDLTGSTREAVKYWWLVLILGILFLATGILVFARPLESYLGLSIVFGFVILLAGIFQIVLAASNRRCLVGWGWLLAAGIIETIIGIVLLANPALSAITLPIFFGFWLMFRGFTTIGVGSDMNRVKAPGAVWTIVLGVLLILLAVWILIQPYSYGTVMVVIWTAVSLVFAGIAAIVYSIQLKNFHKIEY